MSGDALAKCYDRPSIHKSLHHTFFLPTQIWAKRKKKKGQGKGNQALLILV